MFTISSSLSHFVLMVKIRVSQGQLSLGFQEIFPEAQQSQAVVFVTSKNENKFQFFLFVIRIPP